MGLPSAATITGFQRVPENNETALMLAVANQPVAVSVDADSPAFQFYSSGIFAEKCGTKLSHVVAAVGYGISDYGSEYWLLEYSWSGRWEEGGYMRLKKKSEAAQGQCGVAMEAAFPIMT